MLDHLLGCGGVAGDMTPWRLRIDPRLLAAALSTPVAWFLPVALSLRYRDGYTPDWRWLGMLAVTLALNEWLWRRAR